MIRTGMHANIKLIRKHSKICCILRCEPPYFLHWFKMQRSKYKVSYTAQDSAASDKQQVKQVQSTADVQYVLVHA